MRSEALNTYKIGGMGEKTWRQAFILMGFAVLIHQVWEPGVDIYGVRNNQIIVAQIWNWQSHSYCNRERWWKTLNELLAHPEATMRFIICNGNLTTEQMRDCVNLDIIIINVGFQILSTDEGVIQRLTSIIFQGTVRHKLAVKHMWEVEKAKEERRYRLKLIAGLCFEFPEVEFSDVFHMDTLLNLLYELRGIFDDYTGEAISFKGNYCIALIDDILSFNE